MKKLYIYILLLFPCTTTVIAQQLSFNQLVGILQKLDNHDHNILRTIDLDLKVNNTQWNIDDSDASLMLSNTPLESFVCAWSYKVKKQELYRLGVSKSPVNSKLFTSLSYWFPSLSLYYKIKAKAIELGAVETDNKVDEDGSVMFMYKSPQYELILKENPPEISDLTLNGRKITSYQAIVSFR
jgi:hypothetical protein